jgi:hypothetical protein
MGCQGQKCGAPVTARRSSMVRAALGALFALGAAACGYTGSASDNSGVLLSQTTVEEITVRGDYQTIAGCAYAAFGTWAGAGLRKADLPAQKTSQVFLESSTARLWQVDFSETSKGQTKAKLAVAQTVWGPLRKGNERIIPDVKACETPTR